jgi:hypothetical protein
MSRSLTELDLSTGSSSRAEFIDPMRSDARPVEDLRQLKPLLHRQLITNMDLTALGT